MPLFLDWLQSAAKDDGGGRALVYRDTYLSWRGLAHRVDRRAQELRGMGVGEGAWVGLMLGNVPELVILTLALAKLRAVAVPLDPTTSTRDLDMLLDAAPLRALVTRPQGTEIAAPGGGAPALAPGLRFTGGQRTVVSKHLPETKRRLSGTLLVCNVYRREPAPAVVDGIEPTAVLFTVDAGGDPKGVVRAERHFEAVAKSVVSGLELERGARVLATAPLHHGFGFDVALTCALAHRMTLLLEDELSPRHLLRIFREERLDLMTGTPAMYANLARVPTPREIEHDSAHFLCSGYPLSRSVAELFADRFGVRPQSCYHSTETGPVAVDLQGRAPDSVGTPLPGVDVRVTSVEGSELPAGVKGQVWVRAGSVSNASVPKLPVPIRAVGRAGVAIGRADANGWFRTGDLGSFDQEGRLRLDGREDDLVKVEGKRVALGEVAGCLESFAKVRAAEARVVYDDVAGPVVVARVVKSGDVKAEDLIDHCARNLAPHKVPRAIEFCTDL